MSNGGAQGIDVSHYQGTVSWPQVFQAGIAFAFAKATDGLTWTDPEFLDGSGQPVGAEIQLGPANGNAEEVLVAPLSSGGFVASWVEGLELMAATFSAAGELLTGPLAIGTAGNLGLVGLADGGFVAAWGGPPEGTDIVWQRFNAAGKALTPPVQVVSGEAFGPVLLAANPAGQVGVAWNSNSPQLQQISSVLVQLYSAGGTPVGSPVTVATTDLGSSNSIPVPGTPVLGGLAVNLQGQALAAFSLVLEKSTASAYVQLVDATGALAGEMVRIESQSSGAEIPQTVVAEENGDWSVLWASFSDAYVQRFSAAACSPSPRSLCLDDNRFRIDVQFTNPLTGSSSTGNPVPLAAGTGALWFFAPSVPELVVKVLDGTAVNGHFWVFFASLTNVEFDLTVTDTQTGAQRVYHNPAGTLASRADTDFPLAGSAFPPPPAARPAAAVGAPSPSSSASPAAAVLRAAAAGPVCNSSGQALCLLGSEFAATLTFQEPAGSPSAPGHAVQLSAAGGYYWFFGPGDAEVAVKLIDGRAINGHIWVFYASLTNVEFDLTITDGFSTTPARRTYHNPAGTLASVADTGAF
jgi:hypothetical protein